MTFTPTLAWMLSPLASATVTVDGVELEVVESSAGAGSHWQLEQPLR